MSNNVLVLGASGFTGKHFLEYAKNNLKKQYCIIGADLRASEYDGFFIEAVDCTRIEQVDECIKRIQPHYIINFSGVIQAKTIEEYINLNVLVADRLCESVRRNNVTLKKMLLIGSASEYGNPEIVPIPENSRQRPLTLYGLSKSMQTTLADYQYNIHGIPVCIARTFNLIGKGMPSNLSVGSFVKQIRESSGAGIDVGNLESLRDFVDISDAVDAYWKICLHGLPGEVYNVCSGIPLSMRDLLETCIRVSGKKIAYRQKENLVRSNDISASYGDPAKICKDIGWKATTTLESALQKMFD